MLTENTMSLWNVRRWSRYQGRVIPRTMALMILLVVWWTMILSMVESDKTCRAVSLMPEFSIFRRDWNDDFCDAWYYLN